MLLLHLQLHRSARDIAVSGIYCTYVVPSFRCIFCSFSAIAAAVMNSVHVVRGLLNRPDQDRLPCIIVHCSLHARNIQNGDILRRTWYIFRPRGERGVGGQFLERSCIIVRSGVWQDSGRSRGAPTTSLLLQSGESCHTKRRGVL